MVERWGLRSGGLTSSWYPDNRWDLEMWTRARTLLDGIRTRVANGVVGTLTIWTCGDVSCEYLPTLMGTPHTEQIQRCCNRGFQAKIVVIRRRGDPQGFIKSLNLVKLFLTFIIVVSFRPAMSPPPSSLMPKTRRAFAFSSKGRGALSSLEERSERPST